MIQVRNRNCVVCLDTSNELRASAVRVSHHHDWQITTHPTKVIVATVKTGIAESLARHLVLALLREFEVNGGEC